MSPEFIRFLRAECLEELPFIVDDFLGIKASGGGRFSGVHYGRDAYISIITALSEPQNGELPILLECAKTSQRLAIAYQGKKCNPFTEEDKGKIAHEIHTGDSPQQRLAEMIEIGWPGYRLENGRLGMVYYGAGDATPLFNISVAVVHRALASRDQLAAQIYLEEMWPHVKAAFHHDTKIADLDNDGLIESDPQNKNALLNHTWKDSNDAYRDEKGRIPKPPYKYLTNNSYYLWALREGVELAKEMGETAFAAELNGSYARGKKEFHNRFFAPDLGTYAPMIDGKGNRVEFIADDPVIALWAKVIDPEYAKLVIDRLKQPDMNTERGLRTRSSLSSQFRVNGARAYHNGTVWLHQTLIAAKAVENYGDIEFAESLDNKAFALERRLKRKELVAVERERGHLLQYREKGVPVACSPQAWAVFATLGRTAKAA
ncbi:hypothetical protein HYU45_00695 [Candidatus Daviesbacteria bacterium]|nr:hypothetical protein [Candidatus Daviesbacteria bacterium]